MQNVKSYIALFALLMYALAGKAQNNVIDEVIWVVGDEAILKSDVEETRIQGQLQGQVWDGDPYCVIPEQLAIRKLFLHQAAIDSVDVSDGQVMQEVEERYNMYLQQAGSKEKLEEYAQMTSSQLREQLFENLKEESIVSEVRNKLVSNIKVTPAMVRNYFKNVPEDSIPFIPTKVEVQIIVRQPFIPQEEIDRVKDQLRDYTERVNSGQAQFSTLAVMYSEDKESAKRGGDLGFSSRADFVPEFSNVAFNLTDTKTVSKIFETEFGYHIVQLVEKRGDMVNVRHILRKPRVSDEELTKAITFLDSVADCIRKGEYTFDECTPYLSDDKDTKSNYGILYNKMDRERNTKLEMRDLPTEVARAVAGLNIGEISKPFIMINDKGKEVVAIVKLKNRIAGHRATMADDYQQLQNVLMAKLSEEKVESWIREKQKSTYIRINDEWKNCEFKYPGWIK